jgi:hypothetical protein
MTVCHVSLTDKFGKPQRKPLHDLYERRRWCKNTKRKRKEKTISWDDQYNIATWCEKAVKNKIQSISTSYLIFAR